MKFGVIMSSELAKHNRWDPGFLLLNQEYEDRAAALSVTMTAEQAVELLTDPEAIPSSALKVLAPLTRGRIGAPSHEQIIRAIKEYPFLSLAIIQGTAGEVLSAKRDQLTKEITKLEKTEKFLAKSSTDIAGMLPIPAQHRPTIDRNRFVAGVVYFDGNELSIPVETSESPYVADCWVIDLAEWTGPEMLEKLVADGDVPVPRRHEHLGKPIGCLPGMLPDHTKNYGRGWRP